MMRLAPAVLPHHPVSAVHLPVGPVAQNHDGVGRARLENGTEAWLQTVTGGNADHGKTIQSSVFRQV
jgi:hypothetical protein